MSSHADLRTAIRRWSLRLGLVPAFAAALLALASPHAAHAATSCSAGTRTISWDGGAGTTSWQDAANWTGDHVPGTSDHVCIGQSGVTVQLSSNVASVQSVEAVTGASLQVNGGTLTLNSTTIASSIAALSFSSGRIDGAGNLAIKPGGSFSWTGRDSIAGPGAITIAGTASFSMDTSGANASLGRALTLQPSSTGTITGDGVWFAAAGGSVSNAGTLTISGNSRFEGLSVTNTGTIKKTSTGTMSMDAPFGNNGTVNVNAGTLGLHNGDGGSTAGTYKISQPATLDLAGSSSVTFTATAKIQGTGQMVITGATVSFAVGTTYSLNAFNLSGGSLSLSQPYTIPTVSLSGGTLDSSADLTVTTTFAWTGRGAHTGSGTTTIAAGATLTVDTTSANIELGNGRVLFIASGATGTVTADGIWFGYGNGILSNAGTLTVTGSPTFQYLAVTNSGTWTKSSSGTMNIAATVTNSGTLNVDAGVLGVQDVVSNSGTIALSANATFHPTSSSPTTYTQSSTGVLRTHIGGTTAGAGFGQLAVGGKAVLDGTLAIVQDGGFTPAESDTFAIVPANDRSGQFASVTGDDLGHNRRYGVQYTATNANVVVAHTGISVNDVSVTEGSTGSTVNATFTVSLDRPAQDPIGVDVASADGTATSSSPRDYSPVSRTLAFATGASAKQVAVPIVGDCTNEADETFSLNLSNPTGGAVVADASGTGTILNDDGSPQSFAISGPSEVPEGDQPPTQVTFTITVRNPCGSNPISVTAANQNGTATSPADYAAFSQTLTFNPGETSKNVSTSVVGDDSEEPNETFSGKLSNAVGASIGISSAQVVIDDDDGVAAFAGAAGGTLVTTNELGGNRTNLAPSLTALDGQPAWSRDGTQVAAAFGTTIYKVNADGSGLTSLAAPVGALHPTWSPNASQIAFAGGNFSPPSESFSLWEMNADGSNAHAVTNNLDSMPAWSPDGSTIAFVRYLTVSGQQIWLMAPDGSNQRPLVTIGQTFPDDLVWSPDGTTLAFSAQPTSSSDHDVWTVQVADANTLHQITADHLSAYPTWDPSGTKLAFVRSNKLSIMNPDGTGVADIAVPPSTVGAPAWRPDVHQACTIFGTSGADVITGTPGSDVICGLGGNDTIVGNGGVDSLVGGDGNDVLVGTAGDAFLGGNGIDTVSFNISGVTCGVSASLKTTVVSSCSGSGTIYDGTVENLTGTSQGDTLAGNESGNVLKGLGKSDSLDVADGIAGNDTADGGDGTDTCSADAGDTVISCP